MTTPNLNITIPSAGAAGPGYATSINDALAKIDAAFWADPVAFGADPLGVTEATSVVQALLTAGLFVRVAPTANLLVDTLKLKSGGRLRVDGTLKLKAHSTSHNPVVRMGDSTTRISDAIVDGSGTIDGNASAQTFPAEEFSPGVMIWGSDQCGVDGAGGLKITNCQGDGVTIGYDTARQEGCDGCFVRGGVQIWGNARQQVAVTWGTNFEIVDNFIDGVIDLELDATVGEIKNYTVSGNLPRSSARAAASTPLLSNLSISTTSTNPDKDKHSGGTITDNHIGGLAMGYNRHMTVKGNVIVGSDSSQLFLVTMDGVDDSELDNTYIANTAVASSLTAVLRTRACSHIKVRGRAANDSVPFHSFIGGTFAAEPAPTDQDIDVTCTGAGAFRDSATSSLIPLARSALYRLDVSSGTFTLTRLKGPDCNIAAGHSAGDVVITQQGQAYALFWKGECSVSAAAATTLDRHLKTKEVQSGGSNRAVSLYTADATASSPTYSQFAANSGTGTFFFTVEA